MQACDYWILPHFDSTKVHYSKKASWWRQHDALEHALRYKSSMALNWTGNFVGLDLTNLILMQFCQLPSKVSTSQSCFGSYGYLHDIRQVSLMLWLISAGNSCLEENSASVTSYTVSIMVYGSKSDYIKQINAALAGVNSCSLQVYTRSEKWQKDSHHNRIAL